MQREQFSLGDMPFMRKLSLFAFAFATAILASTAACRDSSNNGDDTVTPDSSSGDMTIQQVQDPAMENGTAVTLKGVVVTAIDKFGVKQGDFWVQEPGGGEYSGIQVFGAPLEQVNALAIGDIVDISGAQKDDFAYKGTNGSGGFPAGYALTELKPVMGGEMTVTKVSSGTPLQPTVVDALAIGQNSDFMARDAEWEKWEGVLIKVNNVLAASTQDYVSSKCPGTQCPDMDHKTFDITGGIVVQSSLAAMPTTAVKQGDCLASVTGVGSYFFNYQILPRSTDEIATGGSSCPTENTAQACGDGIDNDGNGFKDCNDNACVLAAAACRPETTISAIQTATTPPTGGIELKDVYVAALSAPSGPINMKTPKNMWVQTSLTAAPNEGIYVFGTGESLAAFPVGSRVNIIGKVTEFNDTSGTETLTEINALKITAGTAGTGTVVPVTNKTATELSSESYESVLVTLSNVKVSTTIGIPCPQGTTPPACNYGVGDATQYPTAGTATAMKTDDDIFLLSTPNACYSTITGIWTYLVRNNSWGFLPLSAGTTGTMCQ